MSRVDMEADLEELKFENERLRALIESAYTELAQEEQTTTSAAVAKVILQSALKAKP